MGGALSAGWKVVAASVAGSAHRRTGASCADACVTRVFQLADGRPLLAAIVADGAGSAAAAAAGAELTCVALLDVLAGWSSRHCGVRELEAETARDWVDHARERIVSLAALELRPPGEYATTLLVALADPEQAFCLQVGDGAAVWRDVEGRFLPALWPQRGEYANETVFLTDPLAAERAQVARLAGVQEVALLSDGLQGLALDLATRQAHAPFFEPLFQRLRECSEAELFRLEAELARWLDGNEVSARSDDDRTLVLASCATPEARPR